MCDWTNLEEIMQDLTVAQRFEVPASLETFGAVGPSPLKIEEEESEEQSYYASQGGGGGDFEGPDLDLIQDMLKMVKEKEDDQQADNPADSSDLDPHNPEYVPQNIQKKIKRNVALESIMTSKKTEVSAIRPVPKDIIPSMFKKKKKKSLNYTPRIHMEETSKNAPPSQTSSHFVKQYTPSTHASEYYKKYLQKSELRQQFEEDIWARAERQMKELEVTKKRNAEIVSPKESGNESLAGVACGTSSFDVNLPEHRHLMPGDCIVCIVAAKHGYYI